MPPTDYVQAGIGTRVGFSTVRGVTFGLGAAERLRRQRSACASIIRRSARRIATSPCRYAADGIQRLWGKTPVLVAAARRARCAPATWSALGGFGLGGVPRAGRRAVDRQQHARRTTAAPPPPQAST